MSELVSIIMPAFNAVKYFPEALDSIKQQDYSNWELIVIDDGSTDDTASLVESFALNDSRIKLIRQSNGRQGMARNNGIRNANGKIIAFLDADDIWTPEKLSLQVTCLKEQQVDLVFTDGFICLENDMTRRDHTFQTLSGKLSGDAALSLFYRMNRVPLSSAICKKEALFSVGLFEEKPGKEAQGGEDYAVWVAMLQKGLKFYGLKEKTLLYRMHNESTNANELNQIEMMIRVIYNFSDKVTAPARLHLFEKYKRLIEIFYENGNIKGAEKYYDTAIVKLFGFPFSSFLMLINKRSPKLFLSIFWRILNAGLKREVKAN